MNYSKLHEIRKFKRLTQDELAKMIGISRNQLQNLEKGGSTTVKTLEAISAALGVSMNTWWDGEQETNSELDPGITKRLKDLENENRDLRNHLKDKEKIIGLMEKQLALYEGKSKAAR